MKTLIVSLRIILVFTIVTGIIYPAGALLYGRIFFPNKAQGSLMINGSTIRGSLLIGQEFTSDKYFHGRPSTSSYDTMASGGSNLSLSNETLLKVITQRTDAVLKREMQGASFPVPTDIVTASASGCDPHISLDSALLQIDRIAKARNTDPKIIQECIAVHTQRRYFSITGEPFVNVLLLNSTLDERARNEGKR